MKVLSEAAKRRGFRIHAAAFVVTLLLQVVINVVRRVVRGTPVSLVLRAGPRRPQALNTTRIRHRHDPNG